MLATTGACAWCSARLYRQGVLMYGQRPGLGQMVKIVRAGWLWQSGTEGRWYLDRSE